MDEDKILMVIDRPSCCAECRFCSDDEMCIATEISGTPIFDPFDNPHWCPLTPLPTKKKSLNKKGYKSGYIEGWNDAIDSIVNGEEKDNEPI